MKRYIRSSVKCAINSGRDFDATMRNLFKEITGVDANRWNYSSDEGAFGYVAYLAIDKSQENSRIVESKLLDIELPSDFISIEYKWRYDDYNAHWDCVISMNRSKDAQVREYDRFRKSL